MCFIFSQCLPYVAMHVTYVLLSCRLGQYMLCSKIYCLVKKLHSLPCVDIIFAKSNMHVGHRVGEHIILLDVPLLYVAMHVTYAWLSYKRGKYIAWSRNCMDYNVLTLSLLNPICMYFTGWGTVLSHWTCPWSGSRG